MRVFLDTNVILDLLLEREGFEDTVAILQMNEDGDYPKIPVYTPEDFIKLYAH